MVWFSIKYLQIIYCVHLDSLRWIWVGLIESLLKSIPRISSKLTSMLHNLNSRFFGEIGRTTLSPVVHDSYHNIGSISILHADCRINWIIIMRNSWLSCFEFMPIYFINLSFLHLESIRISPELSLWIEAIVEFPVHCDVFIYLVSKRNRVKIHLKS